MPRDKDFWHIDWEEEFSDELTDLQLEALDRVAKEVVDRQMAVPVIMFLETIRPMNSQVPERAPQGQKIPRKLSSSTPLPP